MTNKPMTIDINNHVFPDEYLDALPKPLGPFITGWISASKALREVEYRIKWMDEKEIDTQALSLARPTLDDSDAPPAAITKIAVSANNGIARMVNQYPDRFVGVGTVSLRNVGEAIDELDRCVNDLGLLGIQVLSNVDGKPLDLPELEPFYDRVCHHNVPLWIHPTDMRKTYEWVNEFNLNLTLGWPIDTSLAMFRIVRGGVLERHPTLKIIIHHMGALIPFFATRIESRIMQQGKDGSPPAPLSKRPVEYLKMFYVDTAEGSWKPPMVCAQMFFESSHMLFATDFPFTGSEPEPIIETINDLNIPEQEKRMILGENAKELLGID